MVHSYSPNGFIEDGSPELKCCCGIFHIRTGARILAILHMIFYLTAITLNLYINGIGGVGVLICSLSLLFYASALVIGVILEKRYLLLPFLIIQATLTIILSILAIGYGIVGAASDSLLYAHKNVTMVRELYEVHHFDPDDEKTQTLFSCGLLVTLIVLAAFSAYICLVFKDAYSYFKKKEEMIGPDRGYQRGKIVADTLNQDY
uniref:Uncharacterized protein n=1 Tax=Panagrolaimus sp. PS1159 TaxID=55785 RepID=A0AC35GPV6_9BILA